MANLGARLTPKPLIAKVKPLLGATHVLEEYMNQPRFNVVVLPGGQLPKRKTPGAVGFDAHLRTILSQTEMDPKQPELRKTLFDFQTVPENPSIASHVLRLPLSRGRGNELVYRLLPGESILGGIGIAIELPFPIFMGIWPRSGLLIRNRIDVSNAPGTVDPDYRGEAGMLIENRGQEPFDLRSGMRLAQLIFQPAIIPSFNVVPSIAHLSSTKRKSHGFGSTGLR